MIYLGLMIAAFVGHFLYDLVNEMSQDRECAPWAYVAIGAATLAFAGFVFMGPAP